ncbi:MAG: quinone-dependent dihydroorotate dehydrogenase [Bdellovibrionales bacterium]|nr:quinone-dependent dihydroorotate dehydrogenase [Bdellovibrionales bacterium]
MVNYLARPWLALPPSFAHKWGGKTLKFFSTIYGRETPVWSPLEWKGLHFKNRLGTSGGVDKDCEQIVDWNFLGAGFIEVGTVTPRPQPGNGKPNIDRNIEKKAVWNRLGFPSKGLDQCLKNLKNAPVQKAPAPLFINIGKNATTAIEGAANDYIECLQTLYPFADAFVINVSSPNTPGLRNLLKADYLKSFLSPILNEMKMFENPKPLLLKLSPDMQDSELAEALDTSLELGIDGWILTNSSQGLREGLKFPEAGGISGEPLRMTSRSRLEFAIRHLGTRREGRLVISSGGIMNTEEIRKRLELGADLVQVYSALIFEGPLFFQQVGRSFQKS